MTDEFAGLPNELQPSGGVFDKKIDPRLLTPEEIDKAYFTGEEVYITSGLNRVAKAQLAKCQDATKEELKHRLDRPDREKIEEVVTPLAKSYVLSYIHNLNQLEAELKKQTDYIVDEILALLNKY